MERIGDVSLDGSVRKFDTALQDTTRETRETLLRGICVDSRERAGVSRVQELQQIERFAAANLPELRDGYMCGWCEIDRGKLMVIPHAHSHREVRVFDYPAQAEIVGRVTGVAMRIVGDRSPEPRAPAREK
jgi:hypothetical protein